ncbi:metallophosphoesterase [Capilliphycus salinus ALCB114379]|uniref:metallophosphoesterase family protein n=1 Tax=Capilliphycus salinus TaxID=2768948 RepID=UPI0039A71121
MQFISDPSITSKIDQMKQRVRWQESSIAGRNIDQTRLVIDDEQVDNPEFSFLVVGDSGTGRHRRHSPQREVAELLLKQSDYHPRFILHTGDVVYLTGSAGYYPQNFIKPYREFIVGGENYKKIAYDQMVFKLPFLPIPGNHDYYNLPLFYGVMAQLSWPVRHLLKSRIDFDVSWRGSETGDAYAKAFLDYLQKFYTNPDLERHLDQYYTAETSTGRCLRYQPGKFTRLPNRYYRFSYGGIDFFALDSNTFNAPIPIPETQAGEEKRRQLLQRLRDLEQEKQKLLTELSQLDPDNPEQSEQVDDNQAKIEQIDEMQFDIEKRLKAGSDGDVDVEQLRWLQQGLIDSWQTPEIRGRVLFFHHPPYVTEATKWDQAQTLAIRYHLRQVLNSVAQDVGERANNRPIVDLVINGHAHCLEHLSTADTGHADSNMNWIVCGGSGYSLRRQKPDGPELYEEFEGEQNSRPVAKSKLFVGRHGHGKSKRRPYSGLRIDVRDGQPPQFFVQPLVAERVHSQWDYPKIEGFTL